MKKYLLVIVALVAFSCGEEFETTYSVAPELAPYVDTFFNEAAAHGVTLPQNLVAERSTSAQSVADCHTWKDQNYLFVSQSINGLVLEAEIYEELTALFMKRSVNFSDATAANRAAEFNQAFE